MKTQLYQQLFNFLKAYQALRQKVVFDVRQELKKKKRTTYFFQHSLFKLRQGKSATTYILDNDKSESEIILHISKPIPPKPPSKPSISEDVKPWLIGDPYDLEKNVRVRDFILRDTIQVTADQEEGLSEAIDNMLLNLRNWKEVQKRYLALEKEYRTKLRYYSDYFTAIKSMESNPHRSELCLGLGLVTYRDPADGKELWRFLITIPLSGQIGNSGTIEITISPSREEYRVETDFISNNGQFSVSRAVMEMKKAISSHGAESFSELVEAIRNKGIQAFTSSLSSIAFPVLDESLPAQSDTTLKVHFSPVVFWRKRNLESYQRVINDIQEELNEKDTPEAALLDTIVLPPQKWAKPLSQQTNIHEDTSEVLLPLPSNEEQQKIARFIKQQDVVLVQGPPGTGKSHTIANLTTHLLSEGKRILITAQTDQALKSLKQHLPQNFWDLVVYFLQFGGSGKSHTLGQSIKQLIDTINEFNQEETDTRIKKLEKKVNRLQHERRELHDRISSLKNADVKQTYLNEAYKEQPLVSHIETLQERASEDDWWRDPIDDQNQVPTKAKHFFAWYSFFISTRDIPREWRTMATPDPNLLPEVNQLRELVTARKMMPKLEHQLQFTVNEIVNLSRFEVVSSSYLQLRKQFSQREVWKKDCYDDLQAGQIAKWDMLAKETKSILHRLNPDSSKKLLRNNRVDVPQDVTFQQLRADTKLVLEYVDAGNSLTGFLQRFQLPKPIKDRAYIYKECQVNGHRCKDRTALQHLMQFAELSLALEELRTWWYGFPVDQSGIVQQIYTYRNRLIELEDILGIYPKLSANQKELCFMLQCNPQELEASVPELSLPAVGEYLSWRDKEQSGSEVLKKALAYMNQETLATYPLRSKIQQSLRELDIAAYSSTLDQLKKERLLVERLQQEYQMREQLLPEMDNTITWLTQLEEVMPLDQKSVENAMYWKSANDELTQLIGDDLDIYFKRLEWKRAELEEATKSLLKNRAVLSFMLELGHPAILINQLKRWQQAMERSYGQGKKTYTYQREAQRILHEICGQIPCWIMPIYQLVNTARGTAGVFDVIIVDEASQLGPDALFLLYLAKKIIVVGDDEQTAPEVVGVDLNAVQALIKTHLRGIPNSQFFDPKFSFFDHINAAAGRSVTLREHFRCMPEIIAFSNELCYMPKGVPLVPLKQFTDNRLPPLVSQYVKDGFLENDENEIEADAIVDKIKQIVGDSAYTAKTIGIISLRGRSQHLLIQSKLMKALPYQEIDRRRIISGTPPDFQGDERDIILLSLVVAKNYVGNALTKESFKRRYNVAMSRAREQVILFHSIQTSELQNIFDLRLQLLEFFEKKNKNKKEPIIIQDTDRSFPPPKPFDSWFEVDIYQEIRQRGYTVFPQYKVGPYRIDLVVVLSNGEYIAVECDGDRFHDSDVLKRDIQRQLVLERVGWQFVRIRWSQYKRYGREALTKLWKKLKSN